MPASLTESNLITYTVVAFFSGMLIGLLLYLAVMANASLIPAPHEKYERSYNDCIAAETFTQDQCHAIGLEAIN
jgi:hypothetical protein